MPIIGIAATCALAGVLNILVGAAILAAERRCRG
jgi:hypothetical protein